MKKEKKDLEDIKYDIKIVLTILVFLFFVCFILYSGMFKKPDNINVNTNIEYSGGNDIISYQLQNIIPYVETVDSSFTGAYSKNITTLENINNDIFLTMAYLNSPDLSRGHFIKTLNEMYGNKLFIINKPFNVTGSFTCLYDNYKNIYECNKKENKNKLYKANRILENVSISNNSYYLTEHILFFTEFTLNNVVYYEVFSDGSFKKPISSFNTTDLKKENTNFVNYINKYYNDSRVKYISEFILNESSFNWISTEKKGEN
ncbi:MAG: hypothetical protein RSG95_02975 [Bacilli bacterium]